jgi:hypothetical protein
MDEKEYLLNKKLLESIDGKSIEASSPFKSIKKPF